jgi:eukaryotic-like serine/threonine-protein kinase
VTYQLLAGRLPYEATSLTELALAQQREHPPRLDEVDPAVPPALADAVDRALELEPEERYADAEDMRRALDAAGRGAGIADDTTRVVRRDRTSATRAVGPPAARRLEPRAPRQPRPAPAGPARQEDYAQPARRRRGWLAVLLAFVAAGAAAAVVALTASGGGQEVTTQQIDGQDLPTVVEQLESLIDSNIR